jgi:tRNA-dihydrouridine synthase A
MIHSSALVRGHRYDFLSYNTEEHPVAIQLGGCDPKELALAARLCEEHGYDEVNLNVGCPSKAVQKGKFGACLMKDPERVGACVAAMKAAVSIPITVKCRLGVDDQTLDEGLYTLSKTLVQTGVDLVIVHARKALLRGISPKDNRSIPPLNYQAVYDLRQRIPSLPIVINGGIDSLEKAHQVGAPVDGVMIGRAAYKNPNMLHGIDPLFFNTPPPFATRTEILESFLVYSEKRLKEGVPLHHMTQHLAHVLSGMKGASTLRGQITHPNTATGAPMELIVHIRTLLNTIESVNI